MKLIIRGRDENNCYDNSNMQLNKAGVYILPCTNSTVCILWS
uniref:Uncharacterized protein n=1 Tax=Arundo donax TaxID=35708 RepID=A0A0A9SJJ0_ARUDO